MLAVPVLVAVVVLMISTGLLVMYGHRWMHASRWASLGLAAAVTVVAGEVAARVWQLPSSDVVVSEAYVVAVVAVAVRLAPSWNPAGHLFFSASLAAAVAYLALTADVTVAGGLSPVAAVASALIWALEALALAIAVSFSFETADVVCRTAWPRAARRPDPSYRPRVSLHVPAYAEPPDMLIQTIASLEALDYDDYEIVVIDNNTADESLWRPVEEYCSGRDRVRFVHVAPWPGFKSGALNLALREYTSPDAEVIGVVDADYVVQPDYLASTVGYFADPATGFVQTPQDYRDWQGNRYFTACYDAYRYFFETAMPSRNERNSIIFGGTMGLIRRSALEQMGGWDEWCITEDAEASLRMLRAGWSGTYVARSFGFGIMPLSFAALKRQMFRWCFGGIQILRKHHRSLMPWDRDPDNRLSVAQRLDYLFGGLQWFGSLATLGFTVILLATAGLAAVAGRSPVGPLTGASVLLPATILWSGLIRALWALRRRCGISRRRALLAFGNWLSLSWTISLACIRGLVRSEGVFLRTPKTGNAGRLVEALRSTRTEAALAVAAWAGCAVAALRSPDPVLVAVLFGWQGVVYGSSTAMAWLNARSELSSRLQRLARAEERRQRLVAYRPHMVAGAGLATAGVALATFLAFGSAGAGAHTGQLFTLPQRSAGDHGPLGDLGLLPGAQPQPAKARTAPAPTTTTVVTTAGHAGSGSAGRPAGAGGMTSTTTGGSPGGGGGPTTTAGATAGGAGTGTGTGTGTGSATPPAGGPATTSAPPATTSPTTTVTAAPTTTVPATPPSATTVPHGPPTTTTSPTTVSHSPPTSTGRPTTSTTNPHRP